MQSQIPFANPIKTCSHNESPLKYIAIYTYQTAYTPVYIIPTYMQIEKSLRTHYKVIETHHDCGKKKTQFYKSKCFTKRKN